MLLSLGCRQETLITESRVGVGRKRKWRKGKAEEVKLVSGELCPHRELSLSGSYPAGSQRLTQPLLDTCNLGTFFCLQESPCPERPWDKRIFTVSFKTCSLALHSEATCHFCWGLWSPAIQEDPKLHIFREEIEEEGNFLLHWQGFCPRGRVPGDSRMSVISETLTK